MPRFKQTWCLARTVQWRSFFGAAFTPEVSMISRLFRIFLVAAMLPVAVVAQSAPASQAAAPQAPTPAGVKKALTISDYSKWRSIEGAEISPDGKWVAYALRFMN